MNRSRAVSLGGLALILIGIWIVVIPFTRPVPGGNVTRLDVTPEAACGSALLDTIRGDAAATALVHSVEVAFDDSPQEEVTVDCSGRARARVAIGVVVAAAGGFALVWALRRRSDD